MQTEKEIHRLYMMISAKGKKNYSRIKEIGHAGVQECLILGRKGSLPDRRYYLSGYLR